MCTFTSSHITMSVQCTHAMFFCNYNLCLHLACSVQVPIAIHITSVDHRLAHKATKCSVLVCTVALATKEIDLSAGYGLAHVTDWNNAHWENRGVCLQPFGCYNGK